MVKSGRALLSVASLCGFSLWLLHLIDFEKLSEVLHDHWPQTDPHRG